jgi:hypothetical protein
MMKTTVINLVGGLTVTLVMWLITFNDSFLFGIYTFLVFPFLMILFHSLTTQFKWVLSILIFLICLFVAGLFMNVLETNFPDIKISDEEDFPLSHFYVFSSFFWFIIKICIEVVLKILLPTNFTIPSVVEKEIAAFPR